MVVLSVFELSIRPVFDASPVAQLTRRLEQIAPTGTRIGTLAQTGQHLPSRIRVCSGGRLDPIKLAGDGTDHALQAFPLLVATGEHLDRLKQMGYRIEECGYAYEDWSIRDIWTLIRSRDTQAVFALKKIAYYIAIPASPRDGRTDNGGG